MPRHAYSPQHIDTWAERSSEARRQAMNRKPVPSNKAAARYIHPTAPVVTNRSMVRATKTTIV